MIKIFCCGRTPGLKGPAKTKRFADGAKSATEAVSGNDSAVARTSSSERFNRIYNLAKSHFSGVKDYMMPKQSGDRRRGVIEVRLLLAFTSCSETFRLTSLT